MSIESRIRQLEQSLPATSHGGLDGETLRAIRVSMLYNVEAIALEREIAGLESYGHEQLPWSHGKTLYRADLPRMRAECDANWRAWITERFGADVAERFFQTAGIDGTCSN